MMNCSISLAQSTETYAHDRHMFLLFDHDQIWGKHSDLFIALDKLPLLLWEVMCWARRSEIGFEVY